MIPVGILFGGVSVEHEVSVLSGLQVASALDRQQYEPIPIYISKSGQWYTSNEMLRLEAYQDVGALIERSRPIVPTPAGFGKLDLVEIRPAGMFKKPQRTTVSALFVALHGGDGENGSVQGLCETLNIPYTGSGVLGSAVGMDKAISKMICQTNDIPVVEYVSFRESDWANREEAWLDSCEERLGYPVIVKPARLGSSVGIKRAANRDDLDEAIEEAFQYDEKVIVERAIVQLREINCSILGDPNEAEASVLEEPVSSHSERLLTFHDKYQRGGDSKTGRNRGSKSNNALTDGGMASLDRIIPARLGDDRTQAIQQLAVRIFRLFECSGVARIDFMIDEATDQVYFNEINTIPGSFSFYLWEPTGVPFDELTHRLIQIALRRHGEKNSRVRSYETNLLSEKSVRGLKAAKG